MAEKLNRRDFLRLSALSAAGVVVAACAKTPTEAPKAATATPAPEQPKAATATPVPEAGPSEQQAPILAEQVAAGTLPPLEERVAVDAMVVTPHESVGIYGSTWRSGSTGRADGAWQSRTMAWEDMCRWSEDLSEIIPNVAQSWEIANEGREFTFALRKGMKWSDGAPFGADDFAYWHDDVMLNDDLSPSKPDWMRPGDQLGTLEKVDDLTIKFTFAVPNGLFFFRLANTLPAQPKHFASLHHIAYDRAAVEAATAEGNYDDWVAYYGAIMDYRDSPERPVRYGWQIIIPVGSATQMLATRNAYYWKVDTEGNQLPYIDELFFPIVESIDILLMKALNGEIDMMARHFTNSANKPVLADGREKGGYEFFDVYGTGENVMNLCFNQEVKDEGLREVFTKKEFRVAMSHAINRQELIDTVFVGQGTPRQSGPQEASKFYDEEFATQYLEYDPDLANQMLDELGLEMGDDGIRRRFDGEPLYFNVDCMVNATDHGQVMEIVGKMWKEVGVDSAVKNIERALFYERKENNEHEMVPFWVGDGIVVIVDPRSYMAYSHESPFGNAWVTWWNTGGTEGIEPPAPAKRQQELYFNELASTADPEEQEALMREILQIAKEQFWAIGICSVSPGYGIVKNNFKNVPKEMYGWWPARNPAQTNPEQYYMIPEG